MKTLATLIVLSITAVSTANDNDLTGVKCIINGNNPAKAEHSSTFNDATVYFCCAKCKTKFDADPKSFIAKANHQSVLTGQYVQSKCPIKGTAVKDGLSCKIGGVEVGLCCPGCKKKIVGQADLEAKVEMVFTKAAFKKGFSKKASVDLKDVKCMMMPKKDVTAEQSVDYKEGKIYFCCKGCGKKFNKDTEKFAVKANQQLVKTGQYVQTGCPFSGDPVDDEQATEVNGIAVKMCCGDCKKKVDSAADDEARAAMVFSDKAFKNGFQPAK